MRINTALTGIKNNCDVGIADYRVIVYLLLSTFKLSSKLLFVILDLSTNAPPTTMWYTPFMGKALTILAVLLPINAIFLDGLLLMTTLIAVRACGGLA